MEEKKHVCKYCSKIFSCGKSLGGHIRIHMMNEHYSVNNNEERNKNNATMLLKRKRDLGSCGVGEDGNFIYGLRENPKKTTRFVHSNVVNNNNSQNENFCKECGKGFPSLKALCGHMACHSEKDKVRIFEKNSDSVITEKHKLVDSNNSCSQSDTETSLPMKSRRSKRMKFKNLRLLNGSSSVSEVENEEEEIIMCLMKMSEDPNYQGGSTFTLVTDSSENNSLLSEEKSPSSTNYGVIVEKEEEEEKKLKQKDVNLKSKYYDSDYDSDNSDSGYFLYGPKNLDSADEVNSSKLGYFEYLDNSRKRPRPNNDSLGKNLVGASNKRAKKGENNERYNGTYDDSTYESEENSTDSDLYPAAKTQNNNNSSKNLNGKVKKCSKKGKKKLKSKKSKEHECPICNKIFRSGQALGGHKRSHFFGGYEENNTLVTRPDAPPPAPPVAPAHAPAAPAPISLLDLNLPAPDDE